MRTQCVFPTPGGPLNKKDRGTGTPRLMQLIVSTKSAAVGDKGMVADGITIVRLLLCTREAVVVSTSLVVLLFVINRVILVVGEMT